MARIVSLLVLVAILLLLVGVFFQVMADFLLPLFLASLLVIMFGPLNSWFKDRCHGRARIAAALTTTAIFVTVLAPLLGLLIEAGYEAQLYIERPSTLRRPRDNNRRPAELPRQLLSEPNEIADWTAEKLKEFGDHFGLTLDRADVKETIGQGVQRFLGPLALRTTQFLGHTLIGLLVMIIATYYFFADGPAMVRSILRLSPLEGNRTQELLDQFDNVTRAVVLAMILSAFVQGLAAGLGYYVAGAGSVVLLTILSMLLSLVPFAGAAMVWVPVCLWLYAAEGRPTAAVLLAAYCLAVVSVVDNLIKPLVLHGRSNIHPLLALLSVLGGVQALGPIGIFVGPMVVAFLQTLLNMVHVELRSISKA